MQNRIVCLLALCFSLASYAKCPDWLEHDSSVPSCPSDTSILPDNYPPFAHIIADHTLELPPPDKQKKILEEVRKEEGEEVAKKVAQDFKDSAAWDRDVGSNYVVDFVRATLTHSKDRRPLIFVNGQKDTMDKVKAEIDKLYTTDKSRKEALDSIVWIPPDVIRPYPWQQDFFQATFNAKTGGADLRHIANYKRVKKKEVDALFKKMSEACPLLTPAKALQAPIKKSDRKGHLSGGNIEGLPGGLCLHGSGQPAKFVKLYCLRPENQVEIDTKWLLVGHADEIVATIPNTKRPGPCNFSIAVASPRKAMELLSEDANKDKPFFDWHTSPGRDKLKTEENRIESNEYQFICHLVQGKPYQVFVPPEGGKAEEETHVTVKREEKEGSNAERPVQDKEPEPPLRCDNLNNGVVAKALKNDTEFMIQNGLIEKRMEESKELISKRIEERLPECKGQIEYVEVPQLFIQGFLPEFPEGEEGENRHPKEDKGQQARPKKEDQNRRKKFDDPGSAPDGLPNERFLSLLPNVANLVALKDTILSPHPQNSAFKDYVSSEYRNKAGVETAYLDTFDFGHVQFGNLHCTTQTMRYCKPAKTESGVGE